nr:hypothetical protein [Tanacetum cinerariifolium]
MGGNTLIYHFQISLGRARLVIIKTKALPMLLTGEPPWSTPARDCTTPSGIRNDAVLRYKEKKNRKKSVNFRTLITPTGNRADVDVPLESIRVFSSMDGLDALLEDDPWNLDVNLSKRDAICDDLDITVHGRKKK